MRSRQERGPSGVMAGYHGLAADNQQGVAGSTLFRPKASRAEQNTPPRAQQPNFGPWAPAVFAAAALGAQQQVNQQAARQLESHQRQKQQQHQHQHQQPGRKKKAENNRWWGALIRMLMLGRASSEVNKVLRALMEQHMAQAKEGEERKAYDFDSQKDVILHLRKEDAFKIINSLSGKHAPTQTLSANRVEGLVKHRAMAEILTSYTGQEITDEQVATFFKHCRNAGKAGAPKTGGLAASEEFWSILEDRPWPPQLPQSLKLNPRPEIVIIPKSETEAPSEPPQAGGYAEAETMADQNLLARALMNVPSRRLQTDMPPSPRPFFVRQTSFDRYRTQDPLGTDQPICRPEPLLSDLPSAPHPSKYDKSSSFAKRDAQGLQTASQQGLTLSMMLPSSENYFQNAAANAQFAQGSDAQVRHPMQSQSDLSAVLNLVASALPSLDFGNVSFAQFAQAAAMSQPQAAPPAPILAPRDPAAEQRMQLMNMIATMPEDRVSNLLRTVNGSENGAEASPYAEAPAKKQRVTADKKSRRK